MAEYTVASGDNLTKIAAQNNTTVADLAKLNNITDVNKINVGQKINLTPPATTGSTITGANTKNTQGISVTQPQVSTGAVTLQSDIISKGQADTARAVAEEARIATLQGTKAPTATENVLKNILGTSATTPTPQPTQTATTGQPINVNGITADTLASQRQGVQDTLSNVMGETRLTTDQYAGTVDPAKVELDAANAQLNDEALAGRRRIEALMKMPGATKESIADTVTEISRNNASKLADLAVVQMAKQGKYDSAKDIADRAVKAKVEDQKNKLDALLFTYTENKELFTKAEQRQFETAQDDRKRKLDAEEKNLQRISDLSLQALADGAPASVVTKMRNAKTEAEAISLGGSYIGRNKRRLEEAQISKIYQDIAESRAKEDVKKKGLVLTPITAAQAQNKVQQITDLTNNRGIQTSVGTSVFSRAASSIPGKIFKAIFSPGGSAKDLGASLTGARQDYIANVDQLSSQLSIDSLTSAKANGATFGALTDKELELLSNSATKINKWAIRDDNGKVVGYNTSEKSFKAELDKINNYAKLDYIYRGGNGADVGVFQLQDGTYATKNSDGTVEILQLIQ